MIDLAVGEKILKAFEVRKSFHGRGIFYITNFRVYLETQTYGRILDLPFEQIRTYKNVNRNHFRIEWEYDNQCVYYKFRVQGSAKEVFDAYAIANREFAEGVSKSNMHNHQISS